ncbi:hypothetical protein ACHQM5_023071 [Ranunculus cassubicifolius]
MADFAHRTTTKKISNDNNNVFGGEASKFGIIDDYTEIFSSYNNNNNLSRSSIPFLDLPAVDETDFVVDNSIFDYSEIFGGGFDHENYAVPYQELFLEQTKTVQVESSSSSEDVWTPAGSGSPSEESFENPLISQSTQAFSNTESHYGYDGAEQFNMSYHKTNEIGKEDSISGTTRIAQLNAVPAYTLVVDENVSLQTAKFEEAPPEVSKKHNLNKSTSDSSIDGEHYWEALPPQPASEGNQEHQKNLDENGMYKKKPFMTVSEISLRTQPLEVPPPSRPPPKLSKQGSHKIMTSDLKSSAKHARRGVANDSSPPFFDVEVDSTSSAAASAAAMKEAMEKAQATLKSAREMMGGFQRAKMGVKESSKLNEERPHIENGRMNSELKGFDREERQKGIGTAQAAHELELKPRIVNAAMKQPESSHEFLQREVIGEWKAEEQFYELVKKDSVGTVLVAPKLKKSERNVLTSTRLSDHDENEKNAGNAALLQQEKSNGKLQAAKRACESKEDEKRVNVSTEACERVENEEKIKAAQMIHDQEEIQREEREKQLKETLVREETEKKLKAVRATVENEKRRREALQREENERREREETERREREETEKREKERKEKENRLKEAREREEQERKLKEVERRLLEVREKEENERRLKEAHEREEQERKLKEVERRLIEVLEKEENERRLKEAHEREERERLLEEVREREENEKRLNEIREKEENERRLKEELEREDIQRKLVQAAEEERKLSQAREREENERRLKEAHEREENERNERILQEAREREENDRRLRDQLEREEHERRLKEELEREEKQRKLAEAAEEKERLLKEAYERKETEKRIKEEHQREENEKRLRESQEREKNEKRLKQAAEENERRLKDVQKQEENENIRKESSEEVAEKLLLQDTFVKVKSEDNVAAPNAKLNNSDKKTETIDIAVREEKDCQQKKESITTSQTLALSTDNGMKKDHEKKEIVKEREQEKERLRKLEEEKQREREREKDRIAVESVTREAHERAFTEARERAERAAVERATAEARQRAMAEARERLEKACAEAREKSLAEKAYAEARLRAERAAVERATTEARERAEKAMRDRVERSVSEKFSATSRDSALRHTVSFSNTRDTQFQNSSSFTGSQRYSDKSQGTEVDSVQRCKAKLEREQRTVERAAKALAEKNSRDYLAQREQTERNRLAETLDADVKRWSNGKEGNLRALLSTLQYILGADSGWQPVPLTDVVTAVAVKKAYRKATLCVHPDKVQQRGANIQQKYICEKVFDLLKDAWTKFNSEER